MRHFTPPAAADAAPTGLLSRIARRFGGQRAEAAADGTPAAPWWDGVIGEDRVAAFLKWNDLPQTPTNYELATALLALRGTPATERTDALANEAQALTALVTRACDTLGSVATMVAQTGAEAKAYGDALESHVAEIVTETKPEAIVATLVDLTRSMIANSLAAQERLRQMRDEIDTLQANLVEARENASHDMLTALPNRRAIEETLTRTIERAQAIGGEVVLALCDIDHFKRINDTHGHDVGDRMLRLVADILAKAAGPDCFVGRHGGEEFLMLFDGIDAAAAAERVDALREDLARRRLRNRANDEPIGRVTFSAGLATLTPGEPGRALLRRADLALYRAKDNGRNCVVVDGVAGEG